MLLTSFDTESILFGLLNGATSCSGVYPPESRPADDRNEAIEINTIDLSTSTSPQTGTSNVNIYVPDVNRRINGVDTMVSNRPRMRQLCDEVLGVLRAAIIPGCTITPGNVSMQNESNIAQHYVNIRVEWNIQK